MSAVEPACGDSSAATPVVVRGSLPADVVVSFSDPSANVLDARYRAWVGEVELASVTWTSASALAVVIPPGLAAGTYPLTVQAPSGLRATKAGAFEIRAGACPVQTAALQIVDTVAAPATTTVGQDVTVTATVQNYGLAMASAVGASIASAPSGLTLKGSPPDPQDVPAGQARTFAWTYTSSAPAAGVFVIDAAGTAADTGLVVAAPRVNTNSVLVNAGTFLTANTVVSPAAQATVGQLITVALTATNHATAAALVTPAIAVTGPVTAGGVPPAQTIPAGSARTFQWTFTGIAPGSATFDARVTATEPGTGAGVDVPTATCTVEVQSAPALGATLTIPTSIELGEFAVTMMVSNTGGASATTVEGVVPDAPAVQAGSTGRAVLVSGPTGSPAAVVAGRPAVTFTWVFSATTPGTLTLASTARGVDANTGTPVASPLATSNTAPVALHTVSGTVAGLAGAGLLLHDGVDTLPVVGNGAFTFPTPLPTGAAYQVTVSAQPTGPSQTCTVANGSGTVGAANVTGVSVTCATNTFTIGGTVSGLAGTGLQLQNGTETLAIAANGPFTFPAAVASGGTYAVSVAAQPTGPTQTCTISNGAGTVGAANVTSVSVTCSTSTFTVGGSVSGLAGTGLRLNNGTDTLSVAANGPFTFPTAVASGGTYSVTVTAQPGSPSQTCTVTNGSGAMGSANVTNVGVSCVTNTFTIGGTVSGLAGTGLQLRNGTETLAIAANGPFTFQAAVASGGTYAVSVTAQPAGPTQVCTVTNGGGTVGGANVTNVGVSCATSTFTIGGTVSGLAGTGLVLRDGTETLSVTANGTFTFARPVASGASYDVTVMAQPSNPAQSCSVTNGSGTVGNANVTSVAVSCTTSSFTIGGNVSGLSGSGLQLHNGSDTISIGANGAFTFPTPVASGGSYGVTVMAQPSNPAQSCSVTNGSGTVGGANVTNVAVACTTNSFTIGGNVTGMVGSLELRNGGENLTIGQNGPYTFATPVLSGHAYDVSIKKQPPGQTCTLANQSGTVGSANVDNVNVSCATDSFTLGGTVTGLAGSGLVLDDGTESYAPAGNGTFTFPTALPGGTTYAVTVTTHPSGPTQHCAVTNGAGTLTANVTNVSVTCSTSTFTVGGSVSGLAGTGLRLNNGTDTLSITANGPFTFPTAVASGGTYSVTVTAQPGSPSQTCTVTNGSGAMGGSNVTNVGVACTTTTFTIGGTVAGLAGTGLRLNNGSEDLPIAANGSFTFPTAVASGGSYAVTVVAQPTTPDQICSVANGTGTVGDGNVTTVAVECAP